ncbi:MAG: hypothetical protein C0605_16000 [Hyphomicrobiales bacterium]|nr:MAG: hypothetical protein C0605_16000 [Hyphomicrobiales bacterium]
MTGSDDKTRSSDKSINTLIREEGERMVTVRENGRTYKMPFKQAVMRAQGATALKGSPYAQRYILDKWEQCEREEAEEIAEENEIYRRYQERWWAEIEQARREGKPLPNPIPHPDDIIIREGKRVRIDGPVSEFEADMIEENCRMRDVLLMQDALDKRLAENVSDEAPRAAMLCAIMINDNLPSRYQLDETEMMMVIARHEATPKRELLKSVRAGWRSLGQRAPRGFTFPPLQDFMSRFEGLVECVNAIRSGQIDPKPIERARLNAVSARSRAQHR